VIFSYVWALWFLSFLHSPARALSLSTALLVVASLWYLTSLGVSGTTRSSKYAMCCCSYWINSSSCSTCYGILSSTFTSTTITERSVMLTISFTSSFSMGNCSLYFYSWSFSSSKFAWRESFSHSAVLYFSTRNPYTCFKAWVACVVSSCTRRR
jgi:hypothetical protein